MDEEKRHRRIDLWGEYNPLDHWQYRQCELFKPKRVKTTFNDIVRKIREVMPNNNEDWVLGDVHELSEWSPFGDD